MQQELEPRGRQWGWRKDTKFKKYWKSKNGKELALTFWTEANQTDIDINKIPREEFEDGMEKEECQSSRFVWAASRKPPFEGQAEVEAHARYLVSRFPPWALPSHLPLPLSFLQTPQKRSEAVSARAFSPVGEKSLCEAQLQAVPIWFCQLVWDTEIILIG